MTMMPTSQFFKSAVRPLPSHLPIPRLPAQDCAMADAEVDVRGRKRPRCNCATPPWRAEAELRKTAVLLEQMGDVAESLKKRESALEKLSLIHI